MTKFRSEQILAMNESLFQTTKDWRDLSSPNLLKYVFEYGIRHAIQANEGIDFTEVPELLLDFGYDVERLKQFGFKGVLGFIHDVFAVDQYCPTEEGMSLGTFLQSNAHLLKLEDVDWGAERIFFQRAIEHAEKSPLTQKAEAWIQANTIDWFWWRRARRPIEVPVNPCVQTLLTDEEEWSSLEEWQGLVVAHDCCSTTWVWDRKTNEVLFQEEMSGHSLDSETQIVFWSGATVYLWQPSDEDKDELCTLESEFIASVEWLGSNEGELYIVTQEGNIHLFNLETKRISEVLRFDDNRILNVYVVSPNELLVYQDGWNEVYEDCSDEEYDEEDDEYAEYAEYAEDSEDEDAAVSDDGLDDAVEDDEGEEEWEEDEEDEEAPSDPRILILHRQDSASTTFEMVEMYTIGKGEGKGESEGEGEGVVALLISGTKVVITDKKGTTHLLDVSSRSLLKTWSLFEGPRSEVYSVSDTLVGVVQWGEDSQHTTHLVQLQEPFNTVNLSGHTDIVSSMCGLTKGRVLTTSFDATAIVWDVQTGEQLCTIHNVVPHMFNGSIVLDDSRIGVWSVSGHILIWNLDTYQHVGTLLGHTSSVSDVIQLATGYLASIAMFEPSLRVWNPDMAPLSPPLDNHDDVIISDVPSQGQKVLTASHDKTIRVWDRTRMMCEQTFTGHTQPLECLDWVGEDEILSGDWSGEFLHWNTQGEILRRFEGHTDWTRGFKVLDGRRLLSWSDDATLRLWNFDTGECTLIFEGHTEPIRDGALLDSDRWLSWSEDATLRIWDLTSGECMCTLEGHESYVRGAFVLDADRIVSYNYEDLDVPCVVKVWDAKTGVCLKTFTGLDAEVIDWHIESDVLYVRTYANCWQWSWGSPDSPTEWSLTDFEQTHPMLWAKLNPNQYMFENSNLKVVSTDNKITVFHAEERTRWCGDGAWKVRKGFTDGMMVATCWNDVAFLELYRGHAKAVTV